MKKKISFNIVTTITLMIVGYIAYSLLLQDTFFHISISSILSRAHDLELKKHLIVLAFLPIYIALVIFGSFLLGIYLSSAFKRQFGMYKKT
jgi:hypothetical protein